MPKSLLKLNTYYRKIEKSPEMVVAVNSLVALVAEKLITIGAHHLVAPLCAGNRHLAARALFGILQSFPNTQQFIY